MAAEALRADAEPLDTTSVAFLKRLQYWVWDRLLRVMCDELRECAGESELRRAVSSHAFVEHLRRLAMARVRAEATGRYDFKAKHQLVSGGQSFTNCVDQLFPLRSALVALQPLPNVAMVDQLNVVANRYLVLRGRLARADIHELDQPTLQGIRQLPPFVHDALPATVSVDCALIVLFPFSLFSSLLFSSLSLSFFSFLLFSSILFSSLLFSSLLFSSLLFSSLLFSSLIFLINHSITQSINQIYSFTFIFDLQCVMCLVSSFVFV